MRNDEIFVDCALATAGEQEAATRTRSGLRSDSSQVHCTLDEAYLVSSLLTTTTKPVADLPAQSHQELNWLGMPSDFGKSHRDDQQPFSFITTLAG